jgi:hypothetical protein
MDPLTAWFWRAIIQHGCRLRPPFLETGARPSLGTVGISPEAKPVEELTPGCERLCAHPGVGFSDGFFVARSFLGQGGQNKAAKGIGI